jgi:subtilisin-like proprotein convertase family protein
MADSKFKNTVSPQRWGSWKLKIADLRFKSTANPQRWGVGN